MSIATDTIHYCYNCLLPYSPSDSDSFYETTFCGSECEVEYGPIIEEDPAS